MSAIPPLKPPVVLRVSFDILQRSRQLVWQASEDGQIIYQQQGRFAGALRLYIGDRLKLSIFGGYDAEPFNTYKVESAALISLPRSVRDRSEGPASGHYAPSPFDGGSAVQLLTEFYRSGNGVFESQRELAVRNAGFWELSLVLSISYPDTEFRTVHRVFRFDPEADVGNGSRPSDD